MRAAFYAQSIFNGTVSLARNDARSHTTRAAVLMAISPEDSPAACWAAALLTMAVILPAIIQKRLKQLTLHHAMLCLNFATLSAIAALASAPVCEVWRAPDFPESIKTRFAGGTIDTAPAPKDEPVDSDGSPQHTTVRVPSASPDAS